MTDTAGEWINPRPPCHAGRDYPRLGDSTEPVQQPSEALQCGLRGHVEEREQ